MTVGLKLWHLIVSHLGLALIAALSLAAWYGWHRPPVQTVPLTTKILQMQPGETKVVPVIVNGQTIPQTVTAPSPTVRVIVSPAAPVTVTPAQRTAEEKQADIIVTFDLTRDCVHPDIAGIPDPTCGKPVDGHLELVQQGGGFVRLASPGQPVETGPITTQVNRVIPPAPVRPWSFGMGAIGIADHSGFHGVVGPDLAYHRSLGFAELTAVAVADIHGSGVGGLAMLNIPF